jgi:hypothetical protein
MPSSGRDNIIGKLKKGAGGKCYACLLEMWF